MVGGSSKILFQKRAAGKDSHPGLWDVSAAGHVQPGETPVQTALRELGEEPGIGAAAGGLRFAGVRKITLPNAGGSFIDNEITVVHVTGFDRSIRELRIDRAEVEEVRFIGAADLARLMERESFEREFVPHGRDYYRWVMGLAP